MSVRVVENVAAANGVDSTDLEPLYHFIDTDALNELFKPTMSGRDRTPGYILFEYAGQQVSAQSDGTVFVSPVDGE